MGDEADAMLDYYFDELDGFDCDEPCPQSYLHLDDDDLRRLTRIAEDPKIVGIRSWPHPLSEKQRWCLAAWLAGFEFELPKKYWPVNYKKKK